MSSSRDLTQVKRIVVKVGTNLLSGEEGINRDFLSLLCSELAQIHSLGYQVVLVSSGAIGIGASLLQIKERITSIKLRQACASIGQPHLQHHYGTLFAQHGIITSQILLTPEILKNRKSYLNTRNSFETLISLGVLPICNENDTVSTAEIGNAFGDNDRLSALIASKIDADLLIILSDVEGLFDADPRKHPSAKLIPEVAVLDDAIKSAAGGSGSLFATGGMKTKIKAVEIVSKAGCISVIASGRDPGNLTRIIAGKPVGTFFFPGKKASQRSRWILNAQSSGRIIIDQGAVDALRESKSLLPSGVINVVGSFAAGSVVMINDIAKAVPSLDSSEIKAVMGLHSREIRKLTDSQRRDVIARPEDIVFLGD